MGWNNYLVIPSWNMLIETSRYIDEDTLDYISDNINGLTKEIEEFDPNILEENYNKFTLSGLASLVKIADKSIVFQELDYAYLFLMFLKSRDIQFEIIDEFFYDENKDKYKNYRVIE